jgi:hypothetical protein
LNLVAKLFLQMIEWSGQHLNMNFVSMGVQSEVFFEMPIVTIAWALDFQGDHHLISNWKARLFNSKNKIE